MISPETRDQVSSQWGDLSPEEQSDGEKLLQGLLTKLRAANKRIGYVQGRARNAEPKDPRLDRWLAGEDMAVAYPSR